MRIVHTFFCILLLVFAAVQYNDPDFYFWVPVYGVPAVLAAIAAYSPPALRQRALQAIIICCTLPRVKVPYLFSLALDVGVMIALRLGKRVPPSI